MSRMMASRSEKARAASHGQPLEPPAISPRLFNLKQMADYLGCSYWTARDYVLGELVPVVELPPLRPREGERPRKSLRRVLVDRADLDIFIDARKGGYSPDVQSGARQITSAKTGLNRACVPAVCPDEAAPKPGGSR